MQKKVKTESEPSRIQKAKKNIQMVKVIRDLCDNIVWAFDMPANNGEIDGPNITELIDDICPWENEISEDDPSLEGKFRRIFDTLKVSFGFGYVLGQMLDIPDIDITPIKDLLREKKALLYLPHEKKAA